MSAARVEVETDEMPLEDELDLIRRAKVDRNAMATLLQHYDPYIMRNAHQIAASTRVMRYLEDIAQEGRLALHKKVMSYDLERGNARLSTYAHMEVRYAMQMLAGNFAHGVRISMTSNARSAFREMRAGKDPEEIAKQHNLPVETVRKFERHTVSLKEGCKELDRNTGNAWGASDDDDLEGGTERQRDLVQLVWYALTPRQREILTQIYNKMPARDRAAALGINKRQLYFEETRAKKRLLQLAAERVPG